MFSDYNQKNKNIIRISKNSNGGSVFEKPNVKIKDYENIRKIVENTENKEIKNINNQIKIKK